MAKYLNLWQPSAEILTQWLVEVFFDKAEVLTIYILRWCFALLVRSALLKGDLSLSSNQVMLFFLFIVLSSSSVSLHRGFLCHASLCYYSSSCTKRNCTRQVCHLNFNHNCLPLKLVGICFILKSLKHSVSPSIGSIIDAFFQHIFVDWSCQL